VSKNTVWRIYREECLGIKKVTRQAAKKVAKIRILPPPAVRVNERWSIDFIYDHLTNGTRIRGLSVIDQYSRRCLDVPFAKRFTAADVVETLDQIAQNVGQYPKMITSDNGPEFTGLVYDEWTRKNGVLLDYARPGKPTDNGLVESFHARLRDECLSICRFDTLEDAQRIVQKWIQDYNDFRPHSSIGNRVPNDLWSQFQMELDKIVQSS
jgi:putative transposase